MQNISQDVVRNMRIPVPPLDEQHAIVEHIAGETAKLDVVRAATERTIALLAERRSALIAAAVTGCPRLTGCPMGWKLAFRIVTLPCELREIT